MPDEIAPIVGARTGAEIFPYENDEDDLLVSVLWGSAKRRNEEDDLLITALGTARNFLLLWGELFAGALVRVPALTGRHATSKRLVGGRTQ